MKSMLTAMTIALALAAAVHTQSALTGTWQGKTSNGFQIGLDLAATATALTGTLTRNGRTAPIAEGKVSTNTITFTVTFADQAEGFTGELAGDEITLWMNRQGRPGAAVLTRVKN